MLEILLSCVIGVRVRDQLVEQGRGRLSTAHPALPGCLLRRRRSPLHTTPAAPWSSRRVGGTGRVWNTPA